MVKAPDLRSDQIRYMLEKYYDQAIYEAKQGFLPTAETVMDRIHTLPNTLGADLASLIAACRSLRALAERVDDNASHMTFFTDGVGERYVDVGKVLDDWLRMKDAAVWIVRSGAKFSDELHSFAGVTRVDHTNNVEEFSSHTIY